MVDVYELLPPFERKGLQLRDFYIYGDSQRLKNKAKELALLPAEQPDQQWQEAEYDFNRLFVGPAALQAPPYSSVYLGDEPLIMGATTLHVRELMESLGLTVSREDNIPDDHISYELELAVLLFINARSTPGFAPLLQRFVSQHLTLWVPMFIEKITNNASSAVMKMAALELSHWIEELKTRVCHEQ